MITHYFVVRDHLTAMVRYRTVDIGVLYGCLPFVGYLTPSFGCSPCIRVLFLRKVVKKA